MPALVQSQAPLIAASSRYLFYVMSLYSVLLCQLWHRTSHLLCDTFPYYIVLSYLTAWCLLRYVQA